jgi:hypothetical protein
VKSCMTCQRAKPDRTKSPGLLQPLPIPSEVWQIISIDFIDGMPVSGTTICILVVVDKFTMFAHFLPLKHSYTALSIAKVFLNQVYKLHGLPESIISDRESVFTSNFWKELFALAKVQLRLGAAYHSQSDDQTERVKQCLETFLRCFVSACLKSLLKFLSLAEFWYNTSYHTFIGRSPFKVMYVRSPRMLGLSAFSATPTTDMDQ